MYHLIGLSQSFTYRLHRGVVRRTQENIQPVTRSSALTGLLDWLLYAAKAILDSSLPGGRLSSIGIQVPVCQVSKEVVRGHRVPASWAIDIQSGPSIEIISASSSPSLFLDAP